MKQRDGDFIYVVGEHTYVLEPDWSLNGNRLWVKGVAMYNLQLEYIGYWDRHNMPTELIQHLGIHVKKTREFRTAYLKKMGLA